MPGEEQEDIVMTGTQSDIKNLNCPLTGKPITELTEPVRRYYIVNFKHMFPVKIVIFLFDYFVYVVRNAIALSIKFSLFCSLYLGQVGV